MRLCTPVAVLTQILNSIKELVFVFFYVVLWFLQDRLFNNTSSLGAVFWCQVLDIVLLSI